MYVICNATKQQQNERFQHTSKSYN